MLTVLVTVPLIAGFLLPPLLHITVDQPPQTPRTDSTHQPDENTRTHLFNADANLKSMRWTDAGTKQTRASTQSRRI
jgi:hypothetical protein